MMKKWVWLMLMLAVLPVASGADFNAWWPWIQKNAIGHAPANGSNYVSKSGAWSLLPGAGAETDPVFTTWAGTSDWARVSQVTAGDAATSNGVRAWVTAQGYGTGTGDLAKAVADTLYAPMAATKYVPASMSVPVNGYVAVADKDGAYHYVAFSDNNAGMATTHIVPVDGSYKFVLVWQPTANNTSKTLSQVLYSARISTAAGWQELQNYVAWDIAIPNGIWSLVSTTFGTAMTLYAGDTVQTFLYKDDTCGGAAGGIRFYHLQLVKQ